ncbi:DsbA family protein [Wenyingzhuangia sp. chi5]|uniref:DsbA family protein n=1 Tax=Wenyingzhuangia gilva TaxID=3057677 RepID=A0ABT8VSD7_9FLAO|nr:DsbA family protein [Wenyingzhuangia sp. chi5]MDO3694901.1 DsbA family protein [Wenyingzhuangia sp. chi5]
MDTTDNYCDINTGICSPNNNENSPLENNQIEKIKELKITYYYDAFCGWCYGFSKPFQEFKKNHADDIHFEVISGGLFLGNRVGKINDIAPYVKNGAFRSVEEVSGVKFGQAFVNKLETEENIWLDSTLPAIALSIIKENAPNKALDFAELLLKTINYDAKDVRDIDSYKNAVLAIEYDFELFKTQIKEDKYLNLAKQDFETFAKSGISGMPCLVIQGGGKRAYLSNGFASYKDLEARLKIFKEQISNPS